MKIAYLLADTSIAGGTRVAVAHADVLTELGHEATLVTTGGRLTWRCSRAHWLYVSSLLDLEADQYDFVVGTFWTTLPDAHSLAGPRAVHLCQGYEGSFTAYQHLKREIDAAYRLPIPKITVSPHLVSICRTFHDDARYIGQIVDADFFQNSSRSGPPSRVLLVGPAQADFKGIDVGYDAVRAARAAGARFDLVRASQWPPADAEPADLANEFHVALDSVDMARLFASADVFIGPSRAEEGFGLPAAEAMASGVPTVLSEIPSFTSWGEPRDYALFAPEGDGKGLGEQLATLLASASLRQAIAARGRQVAEQFRAQQTGKRLERYFLERLNA